MQHVILSTPIVTAVFIYKTRKKMPYCLSKPKPSNQREDQPVVEATTSMKISLGSNKRKRNEQEEPVQNIAKKV